MSWVWAFLLFFAVLMAGSLWFGYAASEQMVGREAARRNIRYTIWCFLLGLAIACVIPFFGQLGWISFYILYAVGVTVWIISWSLRKREAGSLLADIGRTAQNKFIFWVGLIQVVAAVLQTGSLLTLVNHTIPPYTSLELEIAKLAFWWTFAGFFIALGLNKFELRENGTCFMYAFIRWQRISSYTWETSKPNVLTLRFKPFLPISPGFMSIPIPEEHKGTVDHILSERLPSKKL